jgi:hypothetical protein
MSLEHQPSVPACASRAHNFRPYGLTVRHGTLNVLAFLWRTV